MLSPDTNMIMESNAGSIAQQDETHGKGREIFPCDQCEKTFSRTHFMLKHKRYEHSNKTIKCPKCAYTTTKDHRLKYHLNKHPSDNASVEVDPKPYRCGYCETRCETKQGLKKHVDNKHLGIKFQCSQCEFHGYEIRKHMLIHSEGRHVCDVCGHKSRERKELKYHFLTQHTGKGKPKRRERTNKTTKALKQESVCNQCDFKCRDKGYLKQHILTVHEGKRYSCDKCNHIAKYPGNLQKHRIMVHQDIQNGDDRSTNKSKFLQDEVDSNYAPPFQVRMITELNETDVKPSLFEETRRLENEVLDKLDNQEIKIGGPPDQISIEVLDKLDNQKIKIDGQPDQISHQEDRESDIEERVNDVTHIGVEHELNEQRSHMDVIDNTNRFVDDNFQIGKFVVRNFKCEECESSFTSMNSLKNHRDSRHNERLSSCTKCSFKGTRAQVNYHYFEHNPNICEECGITVPGPPATLRYHILKKHSNTIKQCDKCPFEGTFSKFRYHSMYEHQQPKACEECGMVLKHEKALEYHMKSKHTETEKLLRGRKRKVVEEGAISKWSERKPNIKLKPKISDKEIKIEISKETIEKVEMLVQKKGNTWTCLKCDFQSSGNYKSDFTSHAEKHIEGLEYVCALCDKIFSASVNMRAHYNSTHRVKTAIVVETQEDTKAVNINIEMRYKQKLDSMIECRDGLWTCVVCNYSSLAEITKDRKRKVRMHAEKHIKGENSCTLCGKTCRTLSAMRDHSRTKHKRRLQINYF